MNSHKNIIINNNHDGILLCINFIPVKIHIRHIYLFFLEEKKTVVTENI